METRISYPRRHPLTLQADPLIEVFIVAGLGFVAFRVIGGVTAQPPCGLCAGRSVARTRW
jgi:hypothetical protein